MNSLYELHSILRNLHSNKVLDRRKAFSSLKSALQSQRVLCALDHSSDKKTNLTWDVVVGNVLKLIRAELDRLGDKSHKGPARGSSNKDVLSAATLLRTVIEAANRRGTGRLNLRRLLEHIQRVLGEDTGPGAAALGAHYSRLLLQLLRTPGWQVVLPATLYHELVQLVCRLLHTDEGAGDAVSLSWALHLLVTEGFHQEDSQLEKVLRTLAGCFSRLRGRGSGGSVVAPMLTTLVEVGKRLGPRRRLLLCHLGEPILRSLLVLFTWNSLQLKELALEFLGLQLSLHHPGGASAVVVSENNPFSDENDGASLWGALLSEWHYKLVEELEQGAASSAPVTP